MFGEARIKTTDPVRVMKKRKCHSLKPWENIRKVSSKFSVILNNNRLAWKGYLQLIISFKYLNYEKLLLSLNTETPKVGVSLYF